jgi:hypothetical protein
MSKSWIQLIGAVALTIVVAACAAQLPVLPSGSFDLPTLRPTDEASPSQTKEPKPTKEPTEEPTAEATQEPTGEPTPEPTADGTPEPTAEVTPEPTELVTPAPGTWTGPERISLRSYSDVDIVVAQDGFVHAAATLQGAIWYITNSSGEWVRVQISDPPGEQSDGSPSIVVDGQGLLSVAFERRSEPDKFGQLPLGIYLTTGGPDGWTEPEQLDEDVIREPSLAVKPNDKLNLVGGESVPVDVVEDGQNFPIHFIAGLPEDSNAERIANIGTDPALAIGPDGLARILLGDNIGTLDERTLRFMTATTGSGDFNVENIPGTSNYDNAYDVVVDGNNVAHAVWHAEEDGGLFYSNRAGGVWAAPLLIQEGLVSAQAGLGVDASGVVHIITASYSSGAWYFTNGSGTFTAQQLHDDTTVYADLAIGPNAFSSIAMLWVTAEPDDLLPQELWYAAAPGN